MTKLYEKLDIETIAKLVPEVQEALVEIGARREKETPSVKDFKFVPRSNWDDVEKVSTPMIFYVHRRMWGLSRPASGLPTPYTNVFKGLFMSTIVAEFTKGFTTKEQNNKLSTHIFNQLEFNKLIKRVPGRLKEFWLAPWPTSFTPRFYSPSKYQGKGRVSAKDQVIIERRIGEEADKPISKDFDLKVIPKPGADPTEIVTYVGKLKACFDKLQQELNHTKADLVDTKAELEVAREEIEKLHKETEWAGVADQLKGIINGGDGHENP